MAKLFVLSVVAFVACLSESAMAAEPPATSQVSVTNGGGSCGGTNTPVQVVNRSTSRRIVVNILHVADPGSDGMYCKKSSDTRTYPLEPGSSKFLGCEGTIFEPGGVACARRHTYSLVGARYDP